LSKDARGSWFDELTMSGDACHHKPLVLSVSKDERLKGELALIEGGLSDKVEVVTGEVT
jgi:hypothetical protein